MQISPTSEERVLAALAHAGVVLNSFNLFGVVGAAIIWASQRKQSHYVARHALQALIFQSVVIVLTMLLLFFWGGCILLSLLPAMLQPALYQSDLPPTFWLAVLLGGGVLGFILGMVGYGIAGACAAWRGKSFNYLLVQHLLYLSHLEDQPASASSTCTAPHTTLSDD